MYKKLIILIGLFILTGCTAYNVDDMSYEDIIEMVVTEDTNLYNTNNKGYKYFLPAEFSVYKDDNYNQVLLSKGTFYYLNVDVVSYYYKNNLITSREFDDFFHHTFNSKGKDGYLRIRKNNDYFFVELCYNYAIIEVEVKEEDLKYAVSRGMSILNSIKYNDVVIEKYIGDNDLDSSETMYNIPEPKDKVDNKNVLEYINENEDEE